MQTLQSTLLGGLPEPPNAGSFSQFGFGLFATTALMLIPTALMGATLPMLARLVVHRDELLGPQIGMLYAINTVGAVAGTIAAAFWLMPWVGLQATTWVGVACNLFVVALVLGLVRSGEGNSSDNEVLRLHEPATHLPRARWMLLLIGLSGAISFGYEIVFTRMLSHLLGGSVYAFATMLSGFLLGIAIGGAVGSRQARYRQRSGVAFAYAQVAAAICTLLAYPTLDAIMGWSWDSLGSGPNTLGQVVTSVLVLLPTATCVGATFPLAIRVFAADHTQASSASASVYAASTIGAIVGSLATGGMVMPSLEYHGTVIAAVLGNLGLAIAAMSLYSQSKMHYLAVAFALLLLGFLLPTQPENVIRRSVISNQMTSGELVFNDVGPSATVTVYYQYGELRFVTNGLPEASVQAPGSGREWASSGYWLTRLPIMLGRSIESMMVIGLGGGVAASAVPPSVKEIDVIKLSPAVIEANRAVAMLREYDPLVDPRIRLVVNDARNALALTSKQYDCIVSQPSHPWTSGASHLYTQQFNRQVKAHLEPGGIFLQWMSAEFIDPSLLGNICATLRDVFPYVRIYQPTSGLLLFVASDQRIEPEKHDPLLIAPGDRVDCQRMGVTTPTDLLALLAADEAAVAKLATDSPLILDQMNLLAMRSPQLLNSDTESDIEQTLLAVHPANDGIEALREVCPTVDVLLLNHRWLMTGQAEVTKRCGLKLMESPPTRQLMQVRLDQQRDKPSAFGELVASSLSTDEPRIAFEVLQFCLGKREQMISNEQAARLREKLTPRQARLLDIIEASLQNKVELGKQEDEFLASFPPGDLDFSMALQMRLPWRLEERGPDSISRRLEVLQLIDDNAAYIPFHSVAYFRMLAAIQSGQEFTALSTATQVAREIDYKHTKGAGRLPDRDFNTLQRVLSLVAEPSLFPRTPREYYRSIALFVDGVAFQAENARASAELSNAPPPG